MARRRFYASPDDFSDQKINLSTEETHHLTRVLRLRAGDEVFVFDGRGCEYQCRFVDVVSNRAQVEIITLLRDQVESPLFLTLAQALAKGEKFDLVVQKATELGVSRIVPLLTEHIDVKLDGAATGKRLERWRRISLEAIKQSGRRALVEIAAPLGLADLIESDRARYEAETHAMLVFSEKGGAAIEKALAETANCSSVTALIGPEGGWAETELSLIEEGGCRAVTLGPRILRTETAAIVAISLIEHALGDLSTDNSGADDLYP